MFTRRIKREAPMTYEYDGQLPTGVVRSALIAGILSVILLAIYLFTSLGPTILFGCTIAGLAAVVLGAVALKRKQARSFAVAGLVLGAVGLVAGIGIFAFALLFIGALG